MTRSTLPEAGVRHQDTARLKTMLEAQPDKIVSASIKRRIKSQEKELKSVREKIAQLIKWEPVLDAKSKLLRTIPGLGDIAVQIVLAELPDLEQFEDARQLRAWLSGGWNEHDWLMAR